MTFHTSYIGGCTQAVEQADCSETLHPVEVHNIENAASTRNGSAIDSQINSSVRTPTWLPFAAEVYETSKSVKDYFIVPVVIMPSDLPNRNLTAFPAKELGRFNYDKGRMAYDTWSGSPVHVNHESKDVTKAIGAVVDTALRPIYTPSKQKLWKVVALLAIDRTKSGISEQIEANQRPYYSMGAYVKGYACSVCGEGGLLNDNMKSKYECLPCGTKHAAPDRNRKARRFEREDGSTALGFVNVIYPTGYEISSVTVPAYASAYTPGHKKRDL